MTVSGSDDILDRLREYAKDWRPRANSVKEVKDAIAEIERLRALIAALSDQAGGWQDFSTVPQDQEVEVRGIWKLRGDGFVFTHWRPLPPPSSTAGEG